LLALNPPGVDAAAGRTKAAGATAKIAVTKLGVNQPTLTIAGRVTLPASLTARQRTGANVLLTLNSSTGRRQRFSVPIAGGRTFSVKHRTALTGNVRLVAIVRVG